MDHSSIQIEGYSPYDGGACRICLEDDLSAAKLIAPCRCAGSQKFIHRTCLDSWRATRTGNGRAFTHCEVCNFEYVVQVMEDDHDLEAKRKKLFHARVARDSLLVFLAIQIVIVGLGLIVRACDSDKVILNMFPDLLADNHTLTSYYICGFIIFLAILGLIGFVSMCVNGCSCHDSCNGCYCGNGCDGNCGDCKGEGFLIVLVVMIVVLVFIGVFVGIFMGSMLLQKIIQRHHRRIWLASEAKKYVVVDFNGKVLPERIPTAPPEQYPTPSAPAYVGPAPACTASFPEGLYN